MASKSSSPPEETARFNLGDVRFYEEKFPAVEELVLVRVTRITEMGAYVQLLEYNGLEGMVLMSELSKRRIRSVKKLIRVGRTEVVLVMRVDEQKGYIDLSKRRVSAEEAAKCEERFSKSRRSFAVMAHLAQRFRMLVADVNAMIAWPLNKKYGHALDAFRKPDFATRIVDELNLPTDIKEALLADLAVRLAAAPMKMRARVDVWCYGQAGVDAVRAALLAGKAAALAKQREQVGHDETPVLGEERKEAVQVKMISPPQYIIIVNCSDKSSGDAQLSAALSAIEAKTAEFASAGWKQQGEFHVLGGDDAELPAEDEHDESQDDDSGDSEESDSEESESGSSDDEETDKEGTK